MTDHLFGTIAQFRIAEGIQPEETQEETEAVDAQITEALATATQNIIEFLGRDFSVTMAEPRLFEVELDMLDSRFPSMQIDDLLPDTTDAKVEVTSGGPTSDADWVPVDSSTYWFGPLTRKRGWPLTRFFTRQRVFGDHMRITADWGWQKLPDPVNRACVLSAQRIFKRSDSPLGQLDATEFGPVAVRGVDPDIQKWLRPYKREHTLGW